MSNISSVFYAESYHPIQAGSIDGTDVLPHDNAVYRAHLCSSIGLYDALGDPKVIGDPYCTLFVGRLSHFTTEDTLREAMSKHGRVKNLRLVRHIVTGASRGYAFVEFETEREMRRAYKDAHHSFIDDSEIIVDYNRQQLMPGWVPRRLGGGLGGKKESGQLRFGGRERPFHAPLRPIPYNELKRLGIPPPPEGRYMSRFKVPSPPRRERSSLDQEGGSHRSSKEQPDDFHRRSSADDEAGLEEEYDYHHKRSHSKTPAEREDRYTSYETQGDRKHRSSRDRDHRSRRRRSTDEEDRDSKRSNRSSGDRKEHSHEHRRKSQRYKEKYDHPDY